MFWNTLLNVFVCKLKDDAWWINWVGEKWYVFILKDISLFIICITLGSPWLLAMGKKPRASWEQNFDPRVLQQFNIYKTNINLMHFISKVLPRNRYLWKFIIFSCHIHLTTTSSSSNERFFAALFSSFTRIPKTK